MSPSEVSQITFSPSHSIENKTIDKKANRRSLWLWLVPPTSTIVARNGYANDFQILDFQAYIS